MATLQKDTTFTKIFVGGLPYHTTDQSLREFFEQFGDIEEAVVITDRQTGKSRGYGFVTMADRPAAERACKDPNPIIDGRKANVNLAYIGAKPRVQACEYSFPFALKGGIPGVLQAGQYGLPQYVYPSAAYMASPGVQGGIPGSPLSPTTPSQVFDYASLAATAGYPSGQFASTLDAAAYPYAQAAAAYGAPAAYTYAAMPQPGLAGHFATTAHYQPQQIQERMQ